MEKKRWAPLLVELQKPAISKQPLSPVLCEGVVAPEDVRVQRQPPAGHRAGLPQPERRGHVGALPRDADRRRDGEEDPGPGQEHQEDEEARTDTVLGCERKRNIFVCTDLIVSVI